MNYHLVPWVPKGKGKVANKVNTTVSVNVNHTAEFDSLFVICDRNCAGYYHWTHEQLPRLALLHGFLLANPQVKITVPQSAMINQYLQLLGFAPTQV